MITTAAPKLNIVRWGWSRLGPNNSTDQWGELTVTSSWKQNRRHDGSGFITTHWRIADSEGNTLMIDGDDQTFRCLINANRDWWTTSPNVYLRAAYLGAFTGSDVHSWAKDDVLWAAGQLGITLDQYRNASGEDRAAWVRSWRVLAALRA